MEALRKLWNRILSRISPHYSCSPGQQDHADIVDAVHKSLKEWQLAKDQFNYIEPALVDYMVYRLNAAERHFLALLSLARTQGVKTWPDDLAEPVKKLEFGIGNWELGTRSKEPGTAAKTYPSITPIF